METSFARLSGLDDSNSAEAAAVYRECFATLDSRKVPPIPGMPGVVRAVHGAGLRLAVASSRGHDTLDPMLRALGLLDYFDLVMDHQDAGREKPHPAMLHAIADAFRREPVELVMIGDTVYDLEMGRNAGSLTIGVTWGNHSREELATMEPWLIVDEPPEILQALRLEHSRADLSP